MLHKLNLFNRLRKKDHLVYESFQHNKTVLVNMLYIMIKGVFKLHNIFVSLKPQ